MGLEKRNLFVANIDYSITGEQLREIFEEHGEVHRTRLMCDKETGRSRGFGFVDCRTHQDAINCMEKVNGTLRGTRKMVVRWANEKRSH